MNTCAACGDPVAGRSSYCSATCKANASKRRRRGVPVLQPRPESVPAEPTGVYSATLEQLAAVGRDATPMGAAALALARRIDLGTDSGSALASAVKQLRETIDVALDGTSTAADPLDELRARRDAKRLA